MEGRSDVLAPSGARSERGEVGEPSAGPIYRPTMVVRRR
jgi:hypothetical protein